MNDQVKEKRKYKLLSLHYKIRIYDLISTEINNYEKELISHLEEIIAVSRYKFRYIFRKNKKWNFKIFIKNKIK